MILNEFSKIVKRTKTKKYLKLMIKWMGKHISRPAKNKPDKVLQAECWYAKNKNGDFLIIPKSQTGRNLTQAMYNYIQSLENIDVSRFKHEHTIQKSKKIL